MKMKQNIPLKRASFFSRAVRSHPTHPLSYATVFSCLAFYVVIFINTNKNCTGSTLKLSIISLNLLNSYSFLTQLWIYSHRISLKGDIKLNQGRSEILINVSQCAIGISTALHHIIFPKFSL